MIYRQGDPKTALPIKIQRLALSTLLLNFCHKKQENQAAIFIKSSVDAAQNAFTIFINRTPLSVT